jgi:hypothetical protein
LISVLSNFVPKLTRFETNAPEGQVSSSADNRKRLLTIIALKESKIVSFSRREATIVQRKPLSPQRLQMVWWMAALFALFYISAAEMFAKPFQGGMTRWHWMVGALGAWCAWNGYSLPHKMLTQATAKANRGDELGANRRWSAAQLLALCIAQGVMLWGFFARMVIGCPWWFSTAFYIAGIVLLAVWKPGKRFPPYDPIRPT